MVVLYQGACTHARNSVLICTVRIVKVTGMADVRKCNVKEINNHKYMKRKINKSVAPKEVQSNFSFLVNKQPSEFWRRLGGGVFKLV